MGTEKWNENIISIFSHTNYWRTKKFESKFRIFQLNIVAVSMFGEKGFERKYLALAVWLKKSRSLNSLINSL